MNTIDTMYKIDNNENTLYRAGSSSQCDLNEKEIH